METKSTKLTLNKKEELITVRFQIRATNKKAGAEFRKSFADLMKQEKKEQENNPRFDELAFESRYVKNRRQQELQKIGVTNLYFQPGRAYKMLREEAALYINDTYQGYVNDTGNHIFKLRKFLLDEVDMYVKEHPVAYVVEDRKADIERKKDLKKVINLQPKMNKSTPMLGV